MHCELKTAFVLFALGLVMCVGRAAAWHGMPLLAVFLCLLLIISAMWLLCITCVDFCLVVLSMFAAVVVGVVHQQTLVQGRSASQPECCIMV